MITDTAAIVLRTIPFRESSLIVTVLSEQHGKTGLMARGARQRKSRFGGLLQPAAILDVSYTYKSGREIQNLTEAAQRVPTWRIQEQIEKMALSMATLELATQLCHEHEPMPDMFALLLNFFSWLHQTMSDSTHLFPYLQFRMTQISGIGITMDQANPPRENGYLNITNGSISANSEGERSLALTSHQCRYLRYICDENKSALLNGVFPVEEIRNLIHHMDVYFQYHVEGVKPRRSDSIFDQIL